MSTPGFFVTATDTGVGKTAVATALLVSLRPGTPLAAYKPAVTGLDEPGPSDVDRLMVVADRVIVPYSFGPAVAPHLAAAQTGQPIEFDLLVQAAEGAGGGAAAIVAEGVGGPLVPLDATHDVRDLMVALGLQVIVAARPGLGTISHTLMTLEVLRAAGLTVTAVVLTPWPAEPSALEEDNRATIAARGGVEVEVLRDGATDLPVERWLGDFVGGPDLPATPS